MITAHHLVFGRKYAQPIPTDYILKYSFNGNYTDSSSNANNGVKTGTVNFATGYNGRQCAQFTNGCVKTTNMLNIGGSKITIAFRIKTTQTAVSILSELSSSFDFKRAFALVMNNGHTLEFNDHNDFYRRYRITQLLSSWTHIIFEIDRSISTPSLAGNIYINNILSNNYTQAATSNPTPLGNYITEYLFIGQRNASSIPFVGFLQDYYVFNRFLTEAEKTAIFNE